LFFKESLQRQIGKMPNTSKGLQLSKK